jgi:hypothetical protein
MRPIVIFLSILAVTVMLVGGALASGSNVGVTATVEKVTNPPEVTGSYSLEYNPPSAPSYVGDYKNTDPIRCDFASNNDYGVDLAVTGDHLSGTILSHTVYLKNPIEVAWTPIVGTDYTEVPTSIHFDPDIYTGFLEFLQRMEFADPAGTYSGTLTITLTETPAPPPPT